METHQFQLFPKFSKFSIKKKQQFFLEKINKSLSIMPWSLAFDLLLVIDSLSLQLATQASGN
jgi:hypothetical protein